MKILISRSSPGTIGGAELSAFDQAVVLKELGHDVVLATNLRMIKKRCRQAGIKTIWFPWINRGPGKLRYVIFFLLLPWLYPLALLSALRIRPDIINPHSREDQMAFTHTKPLHRKPVVWKSPGDLRTQLESGGGSFKRVLQKIHMHAISKADHIYLLNSDDQEHLHHIVGKAHMPETSVIPASILYRYYDRSAKPIAKPAHKLIVGTLARAEQDKGLQYLIKAIQQLGCGSDVEYRLVNDGAYKPTLRSMANGLPCISFYPYSEDISANLRSFDILVHPADVEAWGRIVKEAMYFGLPIIGTNVGGIKRQVEDGKTGLLFEPGDVETLAKLLKKLIASKQLRMRLGAAAQKKAEADGDFAKIVSDHILPLYQRYAPH